MNFVLVIYRKFARAFPHEFKLAYGTEVLQLGEDTVEQIAVRHGIVGLFRLIADIAIRLPIEYLSEMQRDMRYAMRALIQSPGFALVGILSMGIGIGLATAVYSADFQVVFRALPAVANATALAMPQRPLSYYYIEQYREQTGLLSGAAAFQNGVPFNVTFQGELNASPERVFGQLVSTDYFNVLGVQAQRGRMLSPELDKPGDAPVVVVSDRFWRNRLNSSPDAVGQVLRLNGQPATIVGIAPKDFNGVFSLVTAAELFVPVTVSSTLAPELAHDVLHQRNAREFMAVLRLAQGVSFESAEAGLDVVTRHLDERDSSAPLPSDKSRRVSLLPAGAVAPLPRELRPVVIGFFLAFIGLIVGIASMNLANMLLARGANRRKELAIRLAVGASRFRLVRQMLNEGILLAMFGGIAGLILAYGISALNARFQAPTPTPTEPDFPLDWRAAAFVFVLSVICGICFSLGPALRATKADVTPSLKHGSAIRLPGYRRFGMRNLLMVSQVAGSLMLLLITGFLVIGIGKLSTVHTKFDPRSMYLFSIDPIREGYTPEKAVSLFEKLPDQLRSGSRVDSITLALQTPFPINYPTTDVSVAETQGQSEARQSLAKETIGAGYFAALNEPMAAGREFNEADQRSPADTAQTTALPVVLNKTAARGFFGNGNAIGRQLRDDAHSYEVVGVVQDLDNGFEIRRSSVIYLPVTRSDFARPPAGGMTIMARSEAGPDALSSIRTRLASIDPNLTIFNVQTLGDYLERGRTYFRFAVSTYGGIGIFSLVLAAIGLAGVTAYAVAQRRKEIGIRTALGARKAQVLRLVLREGAALIGIGTVIGFLGAFALTKIAASLTNVFVDSLRIGTNDLRLLLGAPLLLAGLAMLACYLPARRAAKIDPLRALREE